MTSRTTLPNFLKDFLSETIFPLPMGRGGKASSQVLVDDDKPRYLRFQFMNHSKEDI